jgi:F0F1-type ATP synthase assembly protein I
MDLRKISDFKSVRELSLAVFYYVSGSILGPLLLFGGLGYILDSFLHTSPTGLIVGVFIAFIVTNVLLFKKVKRINGLVNNYDKKEEKIEKEEKRRE